MLRIASPSTTSHVFYHDEYAFAFESLSFLVVNMPPWSLISPASRGIGFALARRVLQTTNAPVVVTARKNLAKAKKELLEGLDVDDGRLTMLEIDVLGMSLRPEDIVVKNGSWLNLTDEYSIKAAAAACKDKFPFNSHALQLAFIVPGLLFPEKSPAQIDAEDALMTFRTNTIGPMLMLKHFSPFLPKKNTTLGGDSTEFEGLPLISTTAVMSARVGSISDNRLGGWYSYRASKAAVNQVVKTFDNHLRTTSGDKAIAVSLHPGTVKTDFSKEFWGGVKKEQLFDRDFVAKRLVDVVKSMGADGRGKCWDWDGNEVPP
jgi:NAD(P)-dependent dehydrogenase (short-subunit alcohol dehydrogenase family)